jgi:hypothetical protein
MLLPLYSTGQGAVVWWVTRQLHSELVPLWLHNVVSVAPCMLLPSVLLLREPDSEYFLLPDTRSVPHQSALHSHLQPGDTITDVNGCTVRSTDSLRACIFAQVIFCSEPTNNAQMYLLTARVERALDGIACRARSSSSTRRQRNSRCEPPSRSLGTA